MDILDLTEKFPPNLEWIRVGNTYVTKFINSDQFSDAVSILSNDQDFELDSSKTTPEAMLYIYTDGVYEIVVAANFETDAYTVTVGER